MVKDKMKNMTRRKFMKKGALALAGSLMFPRIGYGKNKLNDFIRMVLEHELDPLTKKIIQIESDWDYLAEGKDNDIGLMQITPVVLKEWNQHDLYGKPYSLDDLFDPFLNVQVGEWYLHKRIGEHYLPHYKLKNTDENKAASYNAGPTTIGKIGDALENYQQLPKKTQNYLKKLKKLS